MMQKFGAGEVQHDPQDPQGVPVQMHQGSALSPDEIARTEESLRVENARADAAIPAADEPAAQPIPGTSER
jgi:hypothetical protein